MTDLVAPGGPLSATNVHALIDAIQPALEPAMESDPFIGGEQSGQFGALKTWISGRIPNVLTQVQQNNQPAPRK